ncbi:MAG: Dabb family protein [Pseudomonadota bacterium]
MTEQHHPVRHIVMWNVAGDTPAEKRHNIDCLRRSFESLNGRIPGLRHLEIGVDTSQASYACDVVLYSEFDSQEALEAYGQHPEHLQVKAQLGSMRTTRHQVDYRLAMPAPAESTEPGQLTESSTHA